MAKKRRKRKKQVHAVKSGQKKRDLSADAFSLCMRFAEKANNEHICNVPLDKLTQMGDAGISKTEARKCITELVTKGYITVLDSKDVYTIKIHDSFYNIDIMNYMRIV